MATVLAGFRPVKHISGGAYNGHVNRYVVPAAETGAINVGDFVVLSDSAAVGGYPACERSTVTTAGNLLGVVVGFEIDPSNLNLNNIRLASTQRFALVADNPQLIFAAPQNGSGGVIAAASVGLNVAIAVGTAATTAPGASTMLVASNTVATTNTLPLKIVGITDAPDTDITSTTRPSEVLVIINTHQYAPSIAGV
jgi:hypothetical protein